MIARRTLARTVLAVSALVLAVGASLTAVRAVAVVRDVTETGHPGYLSLASDPQAPHWQNLAAGDTVHWAVDASLADADRAHLRLELRSHGALVHAGRMQVSVIACSVPFAAAGPLSAVDSAPPVCPGVSTTILAPTALADVAGADRGTLFPLADLHEGQPRHLLVTLNLAASPAAAATARIGVGVHATGEQASDAGILPVTGGDAGDLAALLITALGAVGIGAGLVLRRRAGGSRAKGGAV